MAQSSGEGTQVLDIDAFMNSQEESKPPELPLPPADETSASSLKREAVSVGEGLSVLASIPVPSAAQNGGQGSAHDVIDLTRPVKTEGEASPSGSTSGALPHPNSIPLQAALSRSSSASAMLPPAPSMLSAAGSPDGLPNVAGAMSPFGGSLGGMGQLGSQLQLTLEEQQQAYKKANLLALSALARKGGPNAREMLGVQAKLQEFLTNLISLAGKQGSHLKLTVQALVQKLVVSQCCCSECLYTHRVVLWSTLVLCKLPMSSTLHNS